MIDTTNADRAEWALHALTGFVEATRVDTARDAIADLMTNLLHLARARGLDEQLLVQQAIGAMAEELVEDMEGDMTTVQARFQKLFPDDS